MNSKKTQEYALCLDNKGYTASLDKMKAYRVMQAREKTLPGFLRIIDESGEDYLYPESMFFRIQVPSSAARNAAVDLLTRLPKAAQFNFSAY